MKKNKKVLRKGARSNIRKDKEKGGVLFRTGSTIQKRGDGSLVTYRVGRDFVGEKHTDEGATFVLRTFEAINKTELNIYTSTKDPLFLSGRDARALLNLLQRHFDEKR